MHFGTKMYSYLSPGDVLTVVSPISVWWLGLVLAVSVFLLLVSIDASRKNQALLGLLMLAVMGLVTSNATVVFNGTKHTGTVRTVTFFYPTTRHYPLSSILGARIDTSDESDAVNLVLDGGVDLQLTPYNQMSGKGHAVFTINQFLQQHGGTGTLY